MSIHVRPSSNAAFYERIRCAEERRNQEIANPCRRPRVAEISAARRRRELEAKLEIERIEREHKEII